MLVQIGSLEEEIGVAGLAMLAGEDEVLALKGSAHEPIIRLLMKFSRDSMSLKKAEAMRAAAGSPRDALLYVLPAQRPLLAKPTPSLFESTLRMRYASRLLRNYKIGFCLGFIGDPDRI